LVDTVLALDPLSDLPRTGWLMRGVRPCESIADHSYAVAVVVMMLVDALRGEGVTIDGERALRMALVHDAAEAKTGDVPMPNKNPAMTAALHTLEGELVKRLLPHGMQEVWREAETGESIEARVVKAADKLQMMCKVLVYERQHRGHLAEFWQNPKNFDDRGIAVAREAFIELAYRAGRQIPR
jgi:putative hydrolase of HD superfamily